MLDEEIVKLFFERREEAIRSAEQQYGRYVKTVAGQFLCDEEDVKECASDVWLDAWNTIPPQKPQSLRVYLAALCRHRAIDRLRRMDAQKRGGGASHAAFEELSECLPGKEEDVGDRVALKDALERFLRALPKDDRKIFMQRYWFGSSEKEVAKEMKMQVNAVKVSLARTRAGLRAFLKKEGFR